MNTDEILKRAKDEFRARNDNRLSKAIGVSRSNVSAWRKRDTVSYSILFWACQKQNKDFNYIITGNRTPTLEVTALDPETELLNAYRLVMRDQTKKASA